jgi:hypothetical protein
MCVQQILRTLQLKMYIKMIFVDSANGYKEVICWFLESYNRGYRKYGQAAELSNFCRKVIGKLRRWGECQVR